MLTTTENPREYDRCDACNTDHATLIDTETGGLYCSRPCAERHTPPETPAHRALVAAAGALGLPTHYRRDLTLWDRLACAAHPAAEPFLWFIRSHGTHILYPAGRPPEPERGAMLTDWRTVGTAADIARAILDTSGRADCRCYQWNGYNLAAISAETAIELAHRWEAEAREPKGRERAA